MIELTDPIDLADHLSADGRTLVMFAMTGCPFCTMFKPIFDAFAVEKTSKMDFLRVLLDDYDDPLWDKFHIEVTPTLILFEKKKVKKRIEGRAHIGLDKGDLKGI